MHAVIVALAITCGNCRQDLAQSKDREYRYPAVSYSFPYSSPFIAAAARCL